MMKTGKKAEIWRNAKLFGMVAVAIAGLAALLIPSLGGAGLAKSYRVEVTAYFYDPLVPAPAALAQIAAKDPKVAAAAIAAAAKVSSKLTAEPETRYEAGSSTLIVETGATSPAAASAASKAALAAAVEAYAALPARQAALEAYLTARDFGAIRLLGRAVNKTAAEGIPVAVTVLKEEEKSGSAKAMRIVLAAGLAALTGLLAAFVLRGKADPERELIALQAPRPSAQ